MGNCTERFESSVAILSVVEILVYYFSANQLDIDTSRAGLPQNYHNLRARVRDFESLQCAIRLALAEMIVSGSELVSSL